MNGDSLPAARGQGEDLVEGIPIVALEWGEIAASRIIGRNVASVCERPALGLGFFVDNSLCDPKDRLILFLVASPAC